MTWKLDYGRPSEIGSALNPEFLEWVQNELHATLYSGYPHIPLFTASEGVSDTDLWLGEFVNNDLRSQYSKIQKESAPSLQFFFGFEQCFDCLERNCVLHTSWHFHFMRVLSTDTETVSTTYPTLDTQIEAWVNQLTNDCFPNIQFTHSSLIGNQKPQVITSCYF